MAGTPKKTAKSAPVKPAPAATEPAKSNRFFEVLKYLFFNAIFLGIVLPNINSTIALLIEKRFEQHDTKLVVARTGDEDVMEYFSGISSHLDIRYDANFGFGQPEWTHVRHFRVVLLKFQYIGEKTLDLKASTRAPIRVDLMKDGRILEAAQWTGPPHSTREFNSIRITRKSNSQMEISNIGFMQPNDCFTIAFFHTAAEENALNVSGKVLDLPDITLKQNKPPPSPWSLNTSSTGLLIGYGTLIGATLFVVYCRYKPQMHIGLLVFRFIGCVAILLGLYFFATRRTSLPNLSGWDAWIDITIFLLLGSVGCAFCFSVGEKGKAI